MSILNSQYNLVVVLGPTATGKTRFASLLSNVIGGEIISADSRQIYRRMSIGTGKDIEDYTIDDKQIPFHLIDIHEPGVKYNVFEFQQDFIRVYDEIIQRKHIPVLCGGTGMYIEAVAKGYKLIAVPVNEGLREKLSGKSLPELEETLNTYKKLHNRTDTDTVKRAIRAIEIEEYYADNPTIEDSMPKICPVYIGLHVDRITRRDRITERLHKRLEEGMVNEVQSLLEEGIKPEDLIYYGLEYKYLTLYLSNEITYDEMVHKLNIAIHQFAKRQMTWFRKMERHGTKINWIDALLPEEEKVAKALEIIG